MTEANFSFTTKINNDLFTVRGNTIDEFTVNLVATATVPAIGHLLGVLDGTAPVETVAQAVNNIAAGLGAAVPVVDPFAPVAPAGGVPMVTPTAGVGDRTCVHGTMVKRSGMGAKGEWRAWFCPTPKGTDNQCKAIFAQRQNPSEWNAF